MNGQRPPLEPIRSAYRLQYLTDEQLDQLQEATLDIPENVGVKFPSEKALRVFAEHGAQVDHDTQVVKIKRDMVFNAMKTVPRYFVMGARAPEYDLRLEDGTTYFTTDGCGVQVCELDPGTIRPSTKADVGMMARIGDYALVVAAHAAARLVEADAPDRAALADVEPAAADLESDDGWADAVAGCAHVLHVASPFPARQPKDEQDLIRAAVEGTLRVLRAAAAANIERFLQTSSTAAVFYGHPPERTAPFTGDDWTNVEHPSVAAYSRSKTLAERAARDFIARERPALLYSSVNPGLVLGPALDRDIVIEAWSAG